ncbi:myo-inositol transporter [Fusarium coicis]|nr:myo-inositol transporter [Fusarium coicis]
MAKHDEVLEATQTQVSHVENDTKGGQVFIEDSAPGLFLNLYVVATAIGGMLFGYDIGVISGVLLVLGDDLDGCLLTPSNREFITALCAAGAFIGAIIAGITADEYGRKPAIRFASVLFTIGAVV